MSLRWRINKFNQDVNTYTPLCLATAYVDLAISAVFFGASFDDYIRYRFWEKSLLQRNRFITYGRSKKIIKKYNMNGEWKVFSDKAEFNKRFYKFVKRDWLLVKDATYEEITSFLKKHDRVIIKPLCGARGNGIKLINSNEISIPDLLKDSKNCIIEEVIVQHDDLKRLNPSSCNTIRVNTFCKNDTVRIICCVLKTGGESFVDNLHSDGVSGAIDPDTGVVTTKGMNYNYKYYVCHPITNEKIVGFAVPNWNKVISAAIECARTVPSVGYVGWDIAVTENGCEVIEGNHDPGHDIMQMVDQVGKYRMITDS